ncbi:MAG TPA: aldehyde dehydrogenase family protein, partial [Blastocatellia bacterium]
MTNDIDRQSVDQAEKLMEGAIAAQKELAHLPQDKIDQIIDAMAKAASADSHRLGELAQQETGFGIAADKATKNRFSAEIVYNFIRPMRTVGVLRDTESVIEVASPRGVVAAIIPSTNP